MIICKPVIKIRRGLHGLRGFFDEIDVIDARRGRRDVLRQCARR